MISLFVPTRKNRKQVWVAALVLLLAALVLPQLVWADHASDHPDSQFDSSSSISSSEAYAALIENYKMGELAFHAPGRRDDRPSIASDNPMQGAGAASSARWVAQGKYYTSERAAAADSARWAAQGRYYVEESERAAAASSARWVAQGKYYTSERAAAADSARWAAQGSSYAAENAVYLADNPKIMAFRRYVASDQTDAAFLGANPEVVTYRRFVLDGCSEAGQVC